MTVIPLVALTACSALYLYQLGRYLDPRLAPLVAEGAADFLKREVRIDHVSVFDRPGVLVLRGVAVSNGKTFYSGHGLAIARIPEAVIAYDLPGLVGDPADAVTMIQTVTLTRPEIYAEQLSSGKFNLSTLIKPPNPAKPFPFQGKVIVKDGGLVVRDDNAPRILGVQQNAFSRVNATVDLTTPGRIAFLGTAAGSPDRFTSVRISGDVLDPSAHSPASTIRGYSLRAQVTRGNVPYLTDYFAPFLRKTLVLGPGIGDADVTVGQFGTAKPGPVTLIGRATVQHGSVSIVNRSILRRPLEDVNTRLTFTTTDLAIDGSSIVSGVPVSVHGAIFNFAHPSLALAIDSDAVTYSGLKDALAFIPALPGSISIPTLASAQTWVTGDFRNPRVEVSAALPSFNYSGTVLTTVRAKADFQDGLLRVEQAEAIAPATHGSLNIQGYVKTQAKPLVYGVEGSAVDVNIAGLPLSASLNHQIGPLKGIASAQFQASNGGIQADVAVSGASAHQVAFSDVSGRVLWKIGHPVELHRLVARLADGGVAYADGQVPAGIHGAAWNLSIQASQIGLGRLVRPFVKIPVGGELYLFGTLRGPGAVPELSGNATVLVPHYGSFVADQLKGTFSATPDGVQIAHAVIQRFPGTAVISGKVAHLASGNPSLDLHVSVGGAQLADLTRLAAQHPVSKAAARAIAASSPTLTGELAADLGVTGSFKQPRVSGQVTLSDATYSTLELDHALAEIDYANDILRVTRLTASGTGFNLQGEGSYGLRTHRITAQASSSIDDIGRLMPTSLSSLSLAGPMTANLTASGTSDNPFATVQVGGRNISVSGIALDDVSLAAQYARGVIESTDGGLKISAGDARYQVSDFRYDPRSTGFSLTGQVGGETVSHLLAVARNVRPAPGRASSPFQSFLARVPQGASGQIVLPVVHAEGTLKNPVAHVVLNAKDLVYGAERLDTIDADVRYANSAFEVMSLEARGKPSVYLSASGQIDPNGPVNAHLEASGIDLSPFNSFLALKKEIGGQISDLTVVASGATRAPVLEASVTLARPSYGKFFVDGLDSGLISVKDNQVSVNGLQIVKDETTASGQVIEHFASVRGALPFAWKADAFLSPVFPSDVPLSLELMIPPQSLSSIPALFPGVALKFPSGTISANIGLGGTLANKQITGSLTVVNGAIVTSQLTTSLRDVNLNLSLVGEQARIAATADSTAGGSIRITGGASLTTGSDTDATQFAKELIGSVHLDLTATATNFSVNEPKITQFGNAGFRGQVNGAVRVTQSLRSPLVEGDVTLSDVVGVLPSLSETAGEAAPIPIVNPTFKLDVTVAHGSRLRNSSLNAQIDGKLKVAGTLAQPDIDGDFAIRQGQFFFPTATFRVVPVGTVHLAYVPPSDPVERVDLTARTQINVSDATIAANPTGAGSEPDAYTAPSYTPASQTARNYTITVKIQGLLNNPDKLSLDFQSDPPGLTQKQILATLGGQQALAGGVSTIFTNLAVPVALQPVERGIASGLGLEDFSVAFAPDAPVQLTFVKQLGKRVELTYTQMVNSRSTGAVANTLEPPVFQIKLDYSFTDRFRLSLSTDDQRNTIIGLERVYSF